MTILAKSGPKISKASLKARRDKYREKVKGIFRFHEVPGGEMTFVIKEFKEDPVEKFTLKDSQIYEIPLGVARHLNKNGWYPKHSHMMDKNGVPIVGVEEKIRRFSFQSLDFVDIEDINPVGTPETNQITIERT